MAVGIPSGGSSNHEDGPSSSSQQHQSLSIDLETLRLHASSLFARYSSRVSFDTLRPLPLFLGVTPEAGFCMSAGAFTPPMKKVDKATPEKVLGRLNLNVAFFLSNYVLVAAMTGLVVALMHPGMLFFVGVVYGLWIGHSYLLRTEVKLFGIPLNSLLTVQQRFYALFVITCIVIILKCLVPTLIFVLITGIIIFAHALLRDPKHIENSNLLSNLVDSDDDDEDGAGSGGSTGSEVMVDRPGSHHGDLI